MITDLAMFFLAVALPLFEILGIITAVHAIMNVRTSQGSIAWAISLITFPFVALPLYWIFGRNRFNGYVESLRLGRKAHKRQVGVIITDLRELARIKGAAVPEELAVFEKLAGFPFTRGNDFELLINGDQTFQSMFAAMEQAKEYILIQYYIIQDDRLGNEFKKRLITKARSGVRVYFLYDEIGCNKLPERFIDDLRKAGVEVSAFKTTKGRGNRFQINFRNHRKITLVDGKTAFIGGHNIGDEYMCRSLRFGNWRDTHVRITGPVVRNIQLSFLNDWYWATSQSIQFQWHPSNLSSEGSSALILPSGPADHVETCSLMFINAIMSARKRFWIASPYFIPSEAVIKALKIAALRGIDIRVMLPMKPDHRIVHLATYSYLLELNLPGIRFFRYKPAFLHQKVFLVDDYLAGVGTANADNRSFRLNFEMTAIVNDSHFARQVERMLAFDFSHCIEIPADSYLHKGVLFRFSVKLARLLSPIL
jgi:cardiolipin synthase